jgi:hypothetical protein
MPSPLGGLASDAARLFRERPALVVGAGVAVLLGVRFLGLGGEASAPADGDASAESASDGYGSYGSIDGGNLPLPGELLGSGVVTDPAPVPAPAPTPAPKVAYLYATWGSGTVATFGGCTEAGKPGFRKTGSFKTAGFAAEVAAMGARPRCDTAGSMSGYRITSGTRSGLIVARDSIRTLTTKYR